MTSPPHQLSMDNSSIQGKPEDWLFPQDAKNSAPFPGQWFYGYWQSHCLSVGWFVS